MNELNRLRLRPSHLILHHAHAYAISDLGGMITGEIDGSDGYYYRQTRFLSKMRFTVEGKQPMQVCAVNITTRSASAYFLAPAPSGSLAGPQPDQPDDDGGEIVSHGIEIQINRFLGEAMYHDIYVTNRSLAPARLLISWEMDGDFADHTEVEEGERQQTAPIERCWRLCEGGGALELRYRHPKLDHGTEIRFSAGGGLIEENGIISWLLNLLPQQSECLRIDVIPVFCGTAVAQGRDGIAFEDAPTDHAFERGLQLTAHSGVVQRAWNRALSDLTGLALMEGDGEERLMPAAGGPNYLALFGRDTLVTGFQTGLVKPAMLRGTLSLIAKWNADKYDEGFDEEPGRVIHQRQQSPLSLLEKRPFLHYYGDYSAPGLFLIDMAWHLAISGDKEFFLSLREKMLATLDWMDRDADRDHDGFYEYKTKAGSWGEKNQGWKDSKDAILYEDGRIVKDPIALVEIQACFYCAKQLMGLAFASLGDHRRAEDLLTQATGLKQRFNQTFWLPEEKYFALCLDPEKKPVKTIASDPGQCLAYGIVDDDKAVAVADRLMSPELFSGWGVRTLSTRHPAFNPFAYHIGSVWPVSGALIGFGLKRYGLIEHFHRLAKALFDATQLFDYDRLPELFGGQPRDSQHPSPGIYPGANSPQAWSAGAIILLVQSMLGLIPLAPRNTLIIDPDLPEWLPELSLTNVQIGGAQVALRFWRDRSGYTHHEITSQQGQLRLYRSSTEPNSGSDRFEQLFREALVG
ncbi:MAG: glycogen debranching N-terminal domain-containing protein [Stellaceae bacterium]